MPGEDKDVLVAYIAAGVSGGCVVLCGLLVLVAVVVTVVGKNRHNKALKCLLI